MDSKIFVKIVRNYLFFFYVCILKIKIRTLKKRKQKIFKKL